MDFKVKCINSRDNWFTDGKVYDVIDGKIIDDDGDRRPNNYDYIIKSIDDIRNYSDFGEWRWIGEFELVNKITKVKCVSSDEDFTVGKIYEINDNKIIDDDDFSWYGSKNEFDFNNITDLNKFFNTHMWGESHTYFELVEDDRVFTKSDLKNGDVIVQRNGTVEILIKDLDCMVVSNGGFNSLSRFNEDLTWTDDKEYDVIKVYRPSCASNCCFNNYKYGKLIYERKETKEMTVKEISDALGYDVKIIK